MPVELPSSPETFKWSVNCREKTKLWMCCHCGRRNEYSPLVTRCCQKLANIPEFRPELDCSHGRCASCTWKWSPERATASPALPTQAAAPQQFDSDPAPADISSVRPDSGVPIFGMYPLPPPLTHNQAANFMSLVEEILENGTEHNNNNGQPAFLPPSPFPPPNTRATPTPQNGESTSTPQTDSTTQTSQNGNGATTSTTPEPGTPTGTPTSDKSQKTHPKAPIPLPKWPSTKKS